MKKPWKIASVVAVVLAVSLVGFFYWATWEGSTKDIVAVADKFQPASDWKLVDSEVIPPRTTCIMGNCPSLNRTWETSKLLRKEEFELLLTRAGWNFDVEENCLPAPNVTGSSPGPVCSASGRDGEYVITTYLLGSNDPSENPGVALFIRKH